MTDSDLHPRPQLARARWIDLGGPWGFAYDDADVGLESAATSVATAAAANSVEMRSTGESACPGSMGISPL